MEILLRMQTHFVHLFKKENNLLEPLFTLFSLAHLFFFFLPQETQVYFIQLYLDSEVFEIHFEMKVALSWKGGVIC